MAYKHSVLMGAGALAALLSLPVLADAKADQARAEEIVSGRCFLCHGMEGESASPVFPRLAGQHAEYLARQLADFKSGKRKSDTMKPQSEELTPAEMKALGCLLRQQEGDAQYADGHGNPGGWALHFQQGQLVLRLAQLRELPWRQGPGNLAAAASGRSASALHRGSAQAIQQARADQRQCGDAYRRFQAQRTRNACCRRVHCDARLSACAHKT